MADRGYITRQAAREVDRVAIEEYGIPGLVLMENAGRACAVEARDMLSAGQGAVILCGPGNNGGDGFVVARYLANDGVDVRVFLVGRIADALARAGDAAANLRVADRMGIDIAEITDPGGAADALDACRHAGLVVDAMLGTGLSNDVREPYRSVINGLNAIGTPVLAVDLPSGLDCDTGRPLGAAVRAQRTVSFLAPKRGFFAEGCADYTGRVVVGDIGAPRSVVEAHLSTREDI